MVSLQCSPLGGSSKFRGAWLYTAIPSNPPTTPLSRPGKPLQPAGGRLVPNFKFNQLLALAQNTLNRRKGPHHTKSGSKVLLHGLVNLTKELLNPMGERHCQIKYC